MLVVGMLIDQPRRQRPLTNLGNERKDLDQQLKTATQVGQPNDDAKAVTLLVNKVKEELAPLPKATAFDLLDLNLTQGAE